MLENISYEVSFWLFHVLSRLDYICYKQTNNNRDNATRKLIEENKPTTFDRRAWRHQRKQKKEH